MTQTTLIQVNLDELRNLIEDVVTDAVKKNWQPLPANEGERLITVNEAAERLGVSKRTFVESNYYGLSFRRLNPTSRKYFVREKDFTDFINSKFNNEDYR